MMRHFLLICALAVLFSGCGIRSEKPKTIASLHSRPVPDAQDINLEDSRARAKAAYRRILETHPDEIMHAESLRRLGDLTLEDEMPQTATSDEDELLLDEKRAKETIELYSKLLEAYPDYRLNDRVLYQLARAYDQSGQHEKSLEAMDQLVKKHPNSSLTSEAQFRRGESLFVQRQYASAEAAYSSAISHPQNQKFLEPALYKKGWSLFKQNKYNAALDDFTQLLEQRVPRGKQDMDRLSRADSERIEDSLRAISLSFVYQDGTNTLKQYFKKRGGRKYEDLVYARLGQYYLDKERYNDSAGTYAAFLESNPWHKQAPEFQVKTIEVYKKGNFPSLVLVAKKEFVRKFDKSSEYWKHHPVDQSPQVITYLKQNQIDLAKHYHAVAQQSKKSSDYAEAEEWYKRFLGSFPKSKEAPEMHYLLAESYYQNKRFGDAATAYEATAYNYGEHPRAAKAGYASLLAYQEQGKLLKTGSRAEWEGRAIQNALRFEKSFPAHPKANEVLTKAAEDLFKRKDYTGAIQATDRLLNKQPPATAAQRKVGWTVAAHSRYENADYAQAETGYTQALKLLDPKDKQRAALTDRLASAVYKQGEKSRDSGKLNDAVKHFLRVAQVAPTSTIRATAEYDAAAALVTLKDWKAAVPVLESFRRNYPKHELQSEVNKKLAAAYLGSNQPGKAAGEFERIVASAKDPATKRDALIQAADLYSKGGQESRSITMLGQYVKDFPQPVAPAMEARYKLAQYYEKKRDLRTASQWHAQIVQADRTAGSQRSDRTRFLAAKSSLALTQNELRAYRSVALVNPLKQNLAKKKQLMKSLLAKYSHAADYQVAEVSTEATYHTGAIYYDFSKALMKSQRPANLRGEALEEYDLLLEEQAIPFEEKAIDVHEINVRRISDGVNDNWVKKSMADLKKLVPARYNKQERDGGAVTRIH